MNINIVLNDAIKYIEDNLDQDIDYEEIAKMLGISVFHFQRLFSFLTGIPIAEYIRCRRLTLAGFDIQKTKAKIIDISLKYRYESHSSFSRAFQAFHGVSPTAIRDEGKSIRIYPPIHLNITIQGKDIINFRIEKTESYELFGKDDTIVPMEHRLALDFIKSYGDRVIENGSHAAINIAAGYSVDENHPFHLLHGIYFKDSENNIHFMYGWEKPAKEIDESFKILEIPKTTWAVFTYEGEHMEGLPKLWNYIYTSWLCTSDYKIEDNIILEKEAWKDESQNILRAQVWLPIKE